MKKKQKELFNRLGVENVNAATLVTWLVIAMSVCGGLVALWVFRRRPDRSVDRTRFYFDVFCDKLEKAGFGRRPSEGSREYLARVSSVFPAVKNQVEIIINDYQDIRYGDEHDEIKRKQFVRCVKQFKVKATVK